jgi:hypothetical protein
MITILEPMTIAYIAHPIGGDVDGNIKKILEIVKDINLNEADVIPFVPYLADVMALDDNNIKHRARGIKNDHEILQRDCVDELRLYGERISDGMVDEMFIAWDNQIEVKAMTPGTESMIDEVESRYNSYLIKSIEQDTVDRILAESPEV